jgi:transcription initiation factor TFIIB
MRCSSCSSSAVLYDQLRGEQICTRCGLVIMERVFELEPEWRRGPGEKLERADVTAGVDVTQHDFGLGSKFSISEDLPPSWRARLRRMQLWQRRSRATTCGERSLREALIELDKFCEDLALPKGVKAEVSVLYRRARAAKLTVGRGTHQVLAALTFITCRLRGLPRSEGEVSRALAARTGIVGHEALRGLHRLTKFFTRKLKLELPRISTDDYINRFAAQLGMSKQVIERAHELYLNLPRSFRQTRPPLPLAAAVLYSAAEASGEKVPLKKVADAVGVSISSVSKNATRVRELTVPHEG